MSRNGSGTYSLPAGNPVVTGTTIASTWANNTLSDIASTLTDSVAADGQTPMTGNLNLNSNKIVNLATPTLSTDAVTKAYADALVGGAGSFTTLTSSGATTFTANTASTSTTTGTAVITGGLGVSGRINAANFDGIVGANTAAAGSFSTLSATGVTTVQAGTVSAPAITTTGDTNTGIFFPAADTIAFAEGGAEAMRITSSGVVCVNRTSDLGTVKFVVESDTTTVNPMTVSNTRSTASTDYHIIMYRAGNIVGSVQTTLSATSFVTSSDYRLKENIAPMTGALSKVAQLNPVTYDWKAGGSSQGFIAHELQAVVPDCVVGDKDEVDADGNIKPQGVDTSFLVATLTAAIQELKAIVDTQATEIALLNSKLET